MTPSLFSSSTKTFSYLLIPAAVILWWVYLRIVRKRLYELAAKIPGPEGYPLIGNALYFLGDPNEIFERTVELGCLNVSEGSPIKVWIGPRLAVFVTDPHDIEILLNSSNYKPKSEYGFFEPWLGDGLFMSTGDKWRHHRKLMVPTFSVKVLKSFIDQINVNSSITVEKMREEGSKSFDVHHYLSASTVDILLETLMAVDKKVHRVNGFKYSEAFKTLCDIIHLRQAKVWLRPNIIFNLTSHARDQVKFLHYIHGITNDILNMKKAAFLRKKQATLESLEALGTEISRETALEPKEEEVTKVERGTSFGQLPRKMDDTNEDDDVGERKQQAFLDSLIEKAENEDALNDDELKDQINTMMFAGHDTPAAASFFLCVMGARSDIQEKVVEELDNIFGDSDRLCTYQDTQEMKYMERCIMETLRLYPPAPIFAREPQEEVTLKSANLTLPADCTVIIGVFMLHRNPNIYANPEVFDPDNFLPERSSARHHHAYIPFGAGPRSCIVQWRGVLCDESIDLPFKPMEKDRLSEHLNNRFFTIALNGRKYAMLKLKILLSTILRNYKIYVEEKEHEWKLRADIVLNRSEGFTIRVEPRRMKPKPRCLSQSL